MIRFRFGQAWKREGQGRPTDAFSLEVDGVDLLRGASEEPLERVVPEMLEGLCALIHEGAPHTGVSLPEAHLELLFRRSGGNAEVHVVSLARPARRLYGPLTVDLEDLAEAASACGRELLRDLAFARPPVPAQERKRLAGLTSKLLAMPSRVRPAPSPPEGFKTAQPSPGDVGFSFTLEDPHDDLRAFRPNAAPGPRADRGALVTLLCGGGVTLHVAGKAIWRSSGAPFLAALELARQGQDLVHALELDEDSFEFSPAGIGPALRVDLHEGCVLQPGGPLPLDKEALARALFELGQRWSQTVRERAPAQSKNPWLEELAARCQEGLAQLATARAQPPDEPLSPAAPRARPAPQTPLSSPGKVRRLRFDRRWEKAGTDDDEPGTLHLGRRGPLVLTPNTVQAFTSKGALRFRHLAPFGVAASADGFAICAEASRLLGYAGGKNAVWWRDGEGLHLGPTLWRKDGLWIAEAQGKGALAFHPLTGREAWRLLPPRTQRAHVTVHGHRALLATDGGFLFGVELGTGQLRYRVRAPLPHRMAPVPWGRRMLTVCGRGELTQLSALDVHTGQTVWSVELPLASPTAPVRVGTRLFIAGREGADGVLCCLSSRGAKLWEKRLHLGEGPFSLLPVERSVVASSPTGAAAQFSADGVPQWRVGAAGDPLHQRVMPVTSRGVLLIPGEVTRAVDPRGGRVMAEVRTGPGVCAVAADPKLNLYVLDEEGGLGAWQLSGALSVV